MELVVCRCKKCRNTIGKFINLWIQIDQNGLVPIIESEDNLKIIYDGIIKHGERGSLSEGWMICASCCALLGAKFVRTPVNHVLYENQIRLSASSVTLSDDAGKQVNLAIKRVITNKEPSSPRATTVNSTETQAESGTPHRPGGINIALSKNELANTAGNDMAKVRNQVQQKLADLGSQVSDLQSQVNTLTSNAHNSASATDQANEVATLRAKNADLRRLLSNTHSNNNSERSIPSTELDILTSNIAKIGNRASQVETLQMEFEILKGKVKRLEADRETAETFMSPNCRKRTSSEAGLPETDLAEKLPVVSTRPSLSTHKPQLSIHRQFTSLEAAEPKGALPGGGQSAQPSLPKGSSKEREAGRGERN